MANHQKHNRRGTNKRTRSYGQLEEYFVSLLHTKQQLEVEGPQEKQPKTKILNKIAIKQHNDGRTDKRYKRTEKWKSTRNR